MSIPLLAGDIHDEVLRANVHPAGRANPTPADRYQLVVIGAGPAGLVAAAAAAGLGAKVALVERDLMGGDCLNVGCVPSKTLIRAGKAAAEIRRAKSFGIEASEPRIDFAAVMACVRRVRAELSPVDSAERFTKLGIDVFFGDGRFTGRDSLEVGGAKLRFGRCIIATGARAEIPESLALGSVPQFTNESVFTLTTLPKRLLIVGGGPIGCELGQAFARLGAKVTLMTKGGRILPREDADAADVVAKALREDGVEICEVAEPTAFDAVLVAAGRKPNVESLNCEAAGVIFDAKAGVTVDDRLRTTNPQIFAAGDVCSLGYRFTHAADAMARMAVQNALFPSRASAAKLIMPWATYTEPELARVGLSEAEAKERGVPVNVYRHRFEDTDRGATDGATGFAKILTANGTDRIVGATVVGPHAGEIAGTLSVLMQNRIGLKRLGSTIFPYPTYTEVLKKIADQFNRTRLTPTAKWALGTWLKWMR